ncbi:MAG: homocysteine S-methyltransferase family protein [Dongiaceae bacterium]
MTAVFERLARGDVIILDGAMGTELQHRGVPMDHVAWSARALATHPGVIRSIHEDYVRVGADIIITNSFGASRHVLEPAGLGDSLADLNRRSVTLAKAARDRAAGGRDIAIAGSISSWVAEGDHTQAPPAIAAGASPPTNRDVPCNRPRKCCLSWSWRDGQVETAGR